MSCLTISLATICPYILIWSLPMKVPLFGQTCAFVALVHTRENVHMQCIDKL